MSAPAAASKPVLLPQKGTARVKNVMSGDTVILWGKAAAPNLPPPQVQFTLDGLMAPRLASKNYPKDDPGAFPAREFLRQMLVGKMVTFETTRRKPVGGGGVVSATAGNDAAPQQYYHYGHLIFENENVGLKIVKNGHAKVRDDFAPPSADDNGDKVNNLADITEQELNYRKQFAQAQAEAIAAGVGIHSKTVAPLVRNPITVEDAEGMVKKTKKVTAVIEYVFDGSRYRCQITKSPNDPSYVHSSFTLILGGVVCPRSSRPSQSMANPPPQVAPNATPEQELEMGAKARLFVEERLLQRELTIVFHGTDKSGGAAVATVQHPKGNIAVEILKNGLGRMADWSVRLMDPAVVPPMRMAENNAKKAHLGVWTHWEAPKLSGAAEIIGTCVEVVSGDTILVLPQGVIYDSEDVLEKVSLASIRSPRLGNERAGRPDEPYAYECKEKLRTLCAGKQVKVQIHYERDIPLSPDVTETRRFGTVAVGKKADVGEVLVQEGLANTQRHRDDDEKSPRYDELRQAEAVAKAGKKGMHKGGEYKRNPSIDLTDPRKAKGYASTLERSGSMRAIVEFCFNGARFKVYIPSENCHIMFAPNFIRCPQPSPSANAAKQGKKAEPFGDASKRHARFALLQRSVEITCTNVTNGGVFTGSLHIGQGAQRRDYGLELVMAGLATVDQRKIDYGEAPKMLVDAQTKAQAGKIGVWSIEREPAAAEVKPAEKAPMKTVKVRLSEIRSGSHFFFQLVDDEAAAAVDSSMKTFTEANGTDGAECEMKVGNVVAALFDDGNGKSWYRAKLAERPNNGKVKVLFIDHGNVATVPVASHLRPLDDNLGTEKYPPVAKEASLALTITRALDTDEGLDAARMLQDMAWGKEMSCSMYGQDDNNRLAVTLQDPSGGETTLNEELVAAGLARVVKRQAADALSRRMVDGSPVYDLNKKLMAAQDRARRTRSGMWRYGDIGDDDDHEGF